jgi:hypothetical protein
MTACEVEHIPKELVSSHACHVKWNIFQERQCPIMPEQHVKKGIFQRVGFPSFLNSM